MFKKEKKEVDRIDIIFCTDKYLLHLNKKYLNHNYYTDTLTFLLSSSNKSITGEIYISIERIRANAKSLKILPRLELIRVIIHSCLHLCGYLDKPQREFLKMEKIQEAYLQQWGVSRETQIGG
ncbi:MAG: metalloprotease ybeY [Chitinophagaceae bacterium]|nr:metalloprotease ybeY [Chitinophagaceae bacterium]MDB5222978.1 metalloprotease ybeY [Chitinophagaceae bacterium]